MYDTLEGEHIRLRKAREDDWRSMLAHVWSDEAVYRWMLFAPTLTEEDARDRARRSATFQQEHFAWFVAWTDTDEAIGYCGMKEAAPGHFEECGICLGTAFQGRGYGREIVALLLDLAFLQLGAEDFRYSYFHENEPSRRLAEHFGFRYTHSYEITRPWDGAVFTSDSCLLTREEYLAQRGEPTSAPAVELRRIDQGDRGAIDDFLVQRWYSLTMVVHGECVDLGAADGFAAYEAGELVGLVTFRMADGAMEVLSLDSAREGRGIGGALLDAAVAEARETGCSRVWLITTNDNLAALGFYQRRGFDMVALHRNALDASRRLKPEIPLIDENGISLQHEIELELPLRPAVLSDTPAVTIREAQLTDEVLAALVRLSADWEAEGSCWGYRANTCEDIQGNRIFLAEDAGQVVGYLFGHRELSQKATSIMPDGTPVFEIEELYVVPARRGQGIGKALFAFAEAAAADDGDAEYLMLSTATKNHRAILHFYLDEVGMQFWSARLFKRIRER